MKNKYTDKQLFLRLLEKVKNVPAVALSLGISRNGYLTWIADDDMFCAKVAELVETFNNKEVKIKEVV